MSFVVAQYASARVETASPVELVVDLYDGAIRFLRQAAVALAAKDIAGKGVALGKAHAIVAELGATLDPVQAPELCAHLSSLYDFVLLRITEANAESNADKIAEAIRVLTPLRDAWAEVARGGATRPASGFRPVVIRQNGEEIAIVGARR